MLRMTAVDAKDPELFKACAGTPCQMSPVLLGGAGSEELPVSRKQISVRAAAVPAEDLPKHVAD